ncbi:MAG: aminoglycoside phosphotransferase family protein [Anaerolineae bacterium]|nr:aminoglycoside phosphotransferase family protein [Anaerolineae bacterium]
MAGLPLPDLEQTITQLIVEVLLVEKERRFPRLILGSTDDKTSVRMSMHYVRALLSYGFSADTPAVQAAIDWFDQPFPRRKDEAVDTLEMNRLMILLLGRPQSEYVKPRLEQLGRQKVEGGYDVQPGWGGYDTLWALDIFTLAHEKGVLRDEYACMDDLRVYLDRLITGREVRRDKDMALALHLQHRFFGGLEARHQVELDRLIAAAKRNKGVWGLEELGWLLSRMNWLDEFTGESKLLPQEVREFQDQFRRVILSTCMVIEYLAPLRADYPQVAPVLDQAMRLWWLQFAGDQTVATLRGLFPKPHDFDYLRVLCRTLRATRAYIDQPLGTLNAVQVHVLHELAEMKKNLGESSEVRHIKAALRSWIHVDLDGDVETLKLGFSDADVVRAHPHIWSPVSGENHQALITDSVIIKYGPRDEIEQERRNYDRLPEAIRGYFVRIPEPSYIDLQTGVAYFIMQDLHDYKTLYEVHEAVSHQSAAVADQLGSFLMQMHSGGTQVVRPASKSLLRELYLRRMMEYVDRVFDFVWEYKLQFNTGMIRDIQDELFNQIGVLVQRHVELRDFPAAHMHGDLHMRNIMIRGLQGGELPNGVTFRLIDLEYLEPDGDAAFDAGQLLVDIELVSREERRYDSKNQLLRLRDSLDLIYREFAENRKDSTFGVRVELAKARALLRIAKGKTKRGSIYLRDKQSIQAAQIADDVMAHAVEALQYLRAVTTSLK